jgi:glycerophosphoryl diester phosphodiesterase
MTKRKKALTGIITLILTSLILVNASWLAPVPKGNPKIISHRGVYHLYDKRKAYGRDTCTAQFSRPIKHAIFENTPESMQRAVALGADMVEIDVAPTKDGKMVLFHDWGVDCRTNGKGDTRELTLADLKSLDIGYGYTADGGKTYPLRGKGVGKIPTVEEGLAALPNTPILFNIKSKDPGEADQLYAILRASGRDTEKIGDAFYGGANPVQRIRKLLPNNWAFDIKREGGACTKQYLAYGWTGIVPKSCRNRMLAIPHNYRWAFWGWPNRLIARMESVGAKIIIFGPYEKNKSNEGLTTAEQLREIPESFNGYIWVEDMETIGAALER